MNIFVTMKEGEVRDSFFTPRALEELSKQGKVVLNRRNRELTREELMERIGETDILFTGWSSIRLDGEILSHAPRLKYHAHTGGSLAPYVSEEEYARGVIVLSGNDLYARSVAEGCLAYILMSLRRGVEYSQVIRQGLWRPTADNNRGLIGRHVGLVGYGAITRYFAELLRWFNVRLSIASRYVSEEELKQLGAERSTKEEIFSTCEIISLHSALNEANRGMITAPMIESIKDGALFVNTARAGLVDNSALLRELKKNRFEAVIDVWDEEPLPGGNPWKDLPNLLAFGHVAGPTFDMREQVVLSLMQDILDNGKGIPCRYAIPYEYARRMTV